MNRKKLCDQLLEQNKALKEIAAALKQLGESDRGQLVASSQAAAITLLSVSLNMVTLERLTRPVVVTVQGSVSPGAMEHLGRAMADQPWELMLIETGPGDPLQPERTPPAGFKPSAEELEAEANFKAEHPGMYDTAPQCPSCGLKHGIDRYTEDGKQSWECVVCSKVGTGLPPKPEAV